MVHHIFEDVNQGTVVFMDKGSNTSLISKNLVNSLYMKGKVKLTTVMKACEKDGETQPMIHHNLKLKDRYGKKHRINCIQVDYITERQDQVDPNVLHSIFPHILKGSLNYPAMDIGLLLG